jgi:hypothetical protein
MAGSLQAVSKQPQNAALWRAIPIALLILALSACGSIDYDFHKENLFASASKKKNIGVVRFHFADGGESHEVRVRRVKGGYAMQAPLHEETNGSFVNFTASRTKSLDYFFGIEGRYNY